MFVRGEGYRVPCVGLVRLIVKGTALEQQPAETFAGEFQQLAEFKAPWQLE